MMAIDWSRPIYGRPTEKADRAQVGRIECGIDLTYHRRSDAVPVKFLRNLYTNDPRHGGTWYFDDAGMSLAGMDPSGKIDAMWTIANEEV